MRRVCRLIAVEGVGKGSRGGGRIGVEVPRVWKFLNYHLEDLDVLNATFAAPCLTTFCRLDALGPEAVGQRLEAHVGQADTGEEFSNGGGTTLIEASDLRTYIRD